MIIPEASPEAEESQEESANEQAHSEAESGQDDDPAYVHPFGPHLTAEEATVSQTTPDSADKLRFEKAKSLAEVCRPSFEMLLACRYFDQRDILY